MLVLPKNYDPTKTYQTLVYLHSGPEDYVRANFPEFISASAQSTADFLAEHGYAILIPDFYGSGGYRKAFHNNGWNDEYKRDHMKRLVAWFDYCIKGIDLPDWFDKDQ